MLKPFVLRLHIDSTAGQWKAEVGPPNALMTSLDRLDQPKQNPIEILVALSLLLLEKSWSGQNGHVIASLELGCNTIVLFTYPFDK